MARNVSLNTEHTSSTSIADTAFTTSSPSPSPPSSQNDISLTQKMLSAVSGSVLTSVLVTPLDVVRVRLQSQQTINHLQHPVPDKFQHLASSSLKSFANLPSNLGVTACCKEVFWLNNNAQYCVAGSAATTTLDVKDCLHEETQRRNFTSTFDGLRKIARNEGFTTLWRGLSPTLLMAVPGNVIYFAGYDWLRVSPHSPLQNRVNDLYAPLVAGSTARVFAALFVSPIELFRTRMQAAHSPSAAGNFRETFAGVRDMVQNQGIHTLWRGLSMTLWRDVPFSALYWWGYEAVREVLLDLRVSARGASSSIPHSTLRDEIKAQHTQGSILADSFVAGAVSGGLASIVTTPFDVGKTRQQVFQHAGDSMSSSSVASGIGSLRPEYRTMPRLLAHIYREEGAAGLFKGWAARCLKVAPACAIMISSYEIGKRMAAQSNSMEDT